MSSPRSRKRDSTLQTLDILNNVGSANASPNARSRVLPPRRKFHAVSRAQEPRSDDIWNIPKSPKKPGGDTRRERAGVSEPITPRRSTRIRETGSSGGVDDKVMRGSGGRRSLRSMRGVDYHEESGEEEEEEEDDEEQEIRLFSDDEPKTTKRFNTRSPRKTSHEQLDDKEFPSFLSPTALLNGQVPSSDDEPDETNETNETYTDNTGQEESDNSEVEQSNSGELGETETHRPSKSRNWRHPPTPVVEIRLPPSSPHKPLSSPVVQEMLKDQEERESDESEWEDEQSFDNGVNGEHSSSTSKSRRPESSPAEQEKREDYIEKGVERESDDFESEEEQLADNAVDEGERSSRTSIPHKPQSSPEQEMHSGHTDGESESEPDDSSEENSAVNEAQGADNARLQSLLAELETRNRTQRQPDEPEPEEDQLPDDTVNDGGESISSFQPEDEQDSSSSSPELSDADEEDRPQRQPRKRRRIERYSPGLTRPQSNQNSMFVIEQSRESESESEESEVSDDEEDEAERAAAIAEEEQTKKLQWMEEAMKLGGQRVNWLILTRTARELKQLVDPALAESFVDIWTTIRVLSQFYGEKDNRPSDVMLRQCDNLFGSIRCEGERLLDRAYHLATRADGARDEVYACDLVDEFEARVIPEMVKLVFACFKIYYTDADMFPGIHDHFRRVLVLLRQLCDRTTSMKIQRIVHGTVRCKELGRALNAIIKALDSQKLQKRKPARSYSPIIDRSGQNGSRGSIVIEDDTGREWSQDEGLALIDGLRAYQGPDRYLQIIRHFGHRLRNRTRQELRAKALQVHDKMQPKISTQVQTAEGQWQWEWLLSVRA